MLISSSTETSDTQNITKLFRYRFVIITIFCCFIAVSYFQCFQFTIISNVVMRYYGVDYLLVDMSGAVFYFGYLPLFSIVGHFVENHTLRTTLVLSSGINATATVLKFFAVSPDRFYLVLISQALCTAAQGFVANIPSKVACTWFGPEEVSTACGIGIFGSQIGTALSMTIPSLVIRNSDNMKLLTEDFENFFIYNAAVCVGMFIIILLFFRSNPSLPPSQAEHNRLNTTCPSETVSYLEAAKKLSKNRDFLVIVATLGTAYSTWIVFGVTINQIYTHSIPDGTNADVGIMSFVAVVSGGCFGTMIFGYILDVTHQFRIVSVSVLLASTLSTSAQAICLQLGSRIGTFIAVTFNGFFSGSIMVLVYEYVVETTYPVPEVIGTTLLNVQITICATLLVFLLNYVFTALSFLAGYIILIFILAASTVGLYLASPQLNRRKANLETGQSEETKRLLSCDTSKDTTD